MADFIWERTTYKIEHLKQLNIHQIENTEETNVYCFFFYFYQGLDILVISWNTMKRHFIQLTRKRHFTRNRFQMDKATMRAENWSVDSWGIILGWYEV
jgi:hypothetical protein